MKRNAALAALALAAALAASFAAGYAAGSRRGPDRRAAQEAASEASFVGELSELHAAHARRLEALRDDPRAIEDANARHRADVRELYRRHGRELPAAMRGGD